MGGDLGLVIVLCLLLVVAGVFWLDALSPGTVSWPSIGAPGTIATVTVAVSSASPISGPSAPRSTPAVLPTSGAWATRTAPERMPFATDIYRDGTFVSQIDKLHCMSAAMQNMLNLIGPEVDVTAATQRRIAAVALPLSTDTIGGGEGPAGWAAGLEQLGAGRYEVRVYTTRAAALRDGVLALRRTGRPVGILAWWGAHSWVLTGFEADADPALFADFRVGGYRIVDPWYPRTSTIWGKSQPPDALHSPADMVRNMPAWTRPEGRYPDRDGKWVMVIPVGPDPASRTASVAA